MKSSPKFSCIITAGGVGKRFDSSLKKQYILLNGKPILHHAIDIFYAKECINEIIVTLPNLTEKIIDTNVYSNRVKYVEGGETRQKSVYNALQACNSKNNFVIIHDGVRPFFFDNELTKMLSLATETPALIAANYVKNTIKQISGDFITKTINRETLIEVYTPQIFKLSLIKDYHEKVKNMNKTFTDDASICEYFSEPVMWFQTTSPSLKITTKEDLRFAEFIVNYKKTGEK